MSRRNFVAQLAISLLIRPFSALAQRTVPVIGFLHPGSPDGYTEQVLAFRQGLGEAGYIDGQNVAIDFRWANNSSERLASLAAELATRKVDVIATAGASEGALAVQRATSTIPFVFAIGADPVKLGLVVSLNRPGGNATGITFLANTLVQKQLELLRDMVPSAAVVGALINPNNPNAVADTKALQVAANSLDRKLHLAHARTKSEIDIAVTNLVQKRVSALLVFPDALFASDRKRLANLTLRHKIPSIAGSHLYPEAGGLMGYGSNPSDVYHQLGIYAGRVLKGSKPADLPVQQPTKFELVINGKTAKALGLTIPQSLLISADKVIE